MISCQFLLCFPLSSPLFRTFFSGSGIPYGFPIHRSDVFLECLSLKEFLLLERSSLFKPALSETTAEQFKLNNGWLHSQASKGLWHYGNVMIINLKINEVIMK
jgi:hypothetical protein